MPNEKNSTKSAKRKIDIFRLFTGFVLIFVSLTIFTYKYLLQNIFILIIAFLTILILSILLIAVTEDTQKKSRGQIPYSPRNTTTTRNIRPTISNKPNEIRPRSTRPRPAMTSLFADDDLDYLGRPNSRPLPRSSIRVSPPNNELSKKRPSLPPRRNSSRIRLSNNETMDDIFSSRLRPLSSFYTHDVPYSIEEPEEDIDILLPAPPTHQQSPSIKRDRSIISQRHIEHLPIGNLSNNDAQPSVFEEFSLENLETSGPVPGIFISHSSKDDIFGSKLVSDLTLAIGNKNTSWLDSGGNTQTGNALWYDSRGGLQGGDNWWDKVMEELKARPIFIIILSPDAMNSGWVKDELMVAWRHKNSHLEKRIIPLLYKPCELPEYLNNIQHISFETTNQYNASLQELLQVLKLPTQK